MNGVINNSHTILNVVIQGGFICGVMNSQAGYNYVLNQNGNGEIYIREQNVTYNIRLPPEAFVPATREVRFRIV